MCICVTEVSAFVFFRQAFAKTENKNGYFYYVTERN